MAPLLSLLPLKQTFYLNPLLTTLPWMILGLFLPFLLPLNIICLQLSIILCNMFSVLSLASTLITFIDPKMALLIFWRKISVLAFLQAKLFQLCMSTSCWNFFTLSLFLNKNDGLIPKTTALQIPPYPKFWNQCPIGKFLGIYHFTIFYLILNMAFIKTTPLVMFWVS